MSDTRGIYSCNNCSAKFLSAPDVKTHIGNHHQVEEAGDGSGRVPIEQHHEGELSSVRNTPSSEDLAGKMPDNVDPEIIRYPEEEEEDDYKMSQYDALVYDLTALREAAIPLRLKIKPSHHMSSTSKLRFWPELSHRLTDSNLKGTPWLQYTKTGPLRSMMSGLEEVKATIGKFALWNERLRTIEGSYGGGVYNYFKFLKWAMGLNLWLSVLAFSLITVPAFLNEQAEPICPQNAPSPVPQGVSNNSLWYPTEFATACCSKEYRARQDILQDVSFNSTTQFWNVTASVLLGLIEGNGWMESTYMYYGGYSTDNIGKYQSAIAYFFVMFSCFSLSLFMIVRSSARSLQQNFKWNEFNTTQYFDLVFGTWDFSLQSEDAVNLRKLGVTNEVNTALSTDRVQEKNQEMSRRAKFLRFIKRLFFWAIVFVIYGFFVFGLTTLYKAVNVSGTETCDSYSDIFSGDNKLEAARCNFMPYATSVTITMTNLILPFFLSYIITFEDYDPKTKLIVDIVRSIFLRLAGLIVMVASLIDQNKCEYERTEDRTLQACYNSGGECRKQMCWETTVGGEFYKLTILDLGIQFAVMLLLDFPRVKLPLFKQSIEFNIPKHVLDVVYSQTICWMGLFFVPMLSFLTFIKLFVIFYLRLAYIKYLCTPSKSLYEASRMSSILKIFLLISFCCAIIPLGVIIGLLQPSNACGPFQAKNPNFYSGLVVQMIKDWESDIGVFILTLIGRVEFLIPVCGCLLLAIYYQWVQSVAQSAYNSRVEEELKRVAEQKRILTSQLARAKENMKRTRLQK